MTRTILYYPTITIKNPRWIRQAIFYWDKIGSIVPKDYSIERIDDEDVVTLRDYDAFVPFSPEPYVKNQKEFDRDIIALLESEEFQQYTQKHDSAVQRTPIYKAKFTSNITNYLIEKDFAEYDNLGLLVLVDKTVALIYMSFLAKFIADQDTLSETTPGTDYRLYRDLVYAARKEQQSMPVLSLLLSDILPVPNADVSLRKILEFKRKRQIELLQFRQVMDSFRQTVKDVREKGELQSVIVQFSEQIKINSELLSRLCKEERITTGLGSLENILKIENLDLLINLAQMVVNPISFATAQKILSGSISVGRFMLEKNNDLRKTLSLNSYSYLFHAQQEGIVQRP